MTATIDRAKPKPNPAVRYLPILGWLPRYDRAWLRGDVIAGLSVWALMVPQALGYATISGVPVEYGLYAAAIALLVYPIFASSRHVVTGPSSTIAAVTGSAVLLVAAEGSPQAVELVALITVLAGALYVLLAVLRMGWLSEFLSESVLTGFIFGIGIEVVIGQLDKLTGSPQAGDNAWQELFSWLRGLPETNLPTLVVGGGLLALLVVLRLVAPRVPGALVATALGIGAAVVLPLAELGVQLLGPVPRGLPSLTLPSLSLLTDNLSIVIPAAVGVLFVGFSESLAAARQYSAKHHYDIDVNQEMLAQGMANTASGLFQGINVAGSLSKSSLNDASGGRTQVASLVQGGLVIVTLLFLAPLFSNLPQAALGAIVIQAVAFGLWKIAEMGRLWRLDRVEFWLAAAALVGVITFGTLAGVFVGVTLSLLWLIWRAAHPAIPVLGRMPDGVVYRSVADHPDATTHPGLVVIRFDGPLFFASAGSLRARVRELIADADPPVRAVILDLESTSIVDLQGAEALLAVHAELTALGIAFFLARTKTSIRHVLDHDGAAAAIGDDHFLLDVRSAVAAALAAMAASAAP
jgi:high affinity sulfate transporter 1